MTYAEKLHAIGKDLATMAAACLANEDVEGAHIFTSACVVIHELRETVEQHGASEDPFPLPCGHLTGVSCDINCAQLSR